jgi:hypothetical protein
MRKSLLGLDGFLAIAVFLLSVDGRANAGTLKAYTFEDVVVIWKSQEDLERAADLMANERVNEGDLDSLIACWANSGQEAEVLSTLSDGLLLKVRLGNEDCEGIVFAEEYED